MINNLKPLSMPEVLDYLGNERENEKELKKFIKKFEKINAEKAKKLRKKLNEMDLIKIKPENIVKIIDLMPDDIESTNKVFTDVSLTKDETQKILETINEFR